NDDERHARADRRRPDHHPAGDGADRHAHGHGDDPTCGDRAATRGADHHREAQAPPQRRRLRWVVIDGCVAAGLALGRYDFTALGTGAVVMTTKPASIDRAVAAAQIEIDAIDRACSRFRPDSDIERVNTASGHTVAVTATFVDALQV